MTYHTIALLGAGSWGTAIGIHLARHGHRVLLWGHRQEHIARLKKNRENTEFLPGIPFPEELIAVDDLAFCTANSDFTFIAVPSHGFSALLDRLENPPSGLTWLTKGLNPSDHAFLSEVVARKWGADYPVAVLSGPSFAGEVARAIPTALTLASNNTAYQKTIHTLLHHRQLRVYSSSDLIGVQLCGAVKNVLAIACGVADGLHLGANTRAALITRGLAEMKRLGKALGAREQTFTGLAGLGDLILTCTDNQSRNRRFGLLLGQGFVANEAEERIAQVVEGRQNAMQVTTLANLHRIDMPICTQVNRLLENKISAHEAVVNLMSRAVAEE